jgi:hypothetical protein
MTFKPGFVFEREEYESLCGSRALTCNHQTGYLDDSAVSLLFYQIIIQYVHRL